MTGDTGITEATADTITDFSTGTDKIDIATVGSYVEADGTGNADLAAFIADANASLPTTSIDIYAEYNFKGEGNTLVVIDENKSYQHATDQYRGQFPCSIANCVTEISPPLFSAANTY